MNDNYDFCGWATKNDIKCQDGRIIRRDAFKVNDGKRVPLVWNHSHDDASNVLGHAILENREDGVYAFCSLNDTEQGDNAKKIVAHGDVESLSIYANQVKQKGYEVVHGAIKELSLVLAGSNPGAVIETIFAHSDSSDDEVIFCTGEVISMDETILHACNTKKNVVDNKQDTDAKNNKNDNEETAQEIFDTLTDKQKKVVIAIVNQVRNDDESENDESENDEKENEKKEDTKKGGNTMKHNIFDNDSSRENENNTLTHSEMTTIISDAKRIGSLKESFFQHAEQYGITNIDYLFPDSKNVTNVPQFIQRDMGWVQKVMSSIHKTPFSRIKSVFANISEDDARAKGYIKGHLKKEEVFSLLKRTTSPTTVYKKQKLERDDVVDITDFDVVTWLKSEMRLMLDEEIARAVLVGDGRLASSDDKIKEDNIRPISKDAALYTIQATVDVVTGADSDTRAKAFIRKAIKTRKDYKGSGNPTMFTTEDVLTDCLLLEDKNGRPMYESTVKLATTLRCSEIISVPVMENQKGLNDKPLMGIIVNLDDYNIGADKGGAVNMFDDFDIDYNAQKYLIETRCSGALIRPYSAIAFTLNEVAQTPPVK